MSSPARSSSRRTPRAFATSTSRNRPQMRIEVDAMGGDHAPEEIVKGAARAAVEYGIDISLVGIPASVQPLLDSHPRLQLVPCTQVVAMDEHPARAVRNKPDSSISVCARLC